MQLVIRLLTAQYPHHLLRYYYVLVHRQRNL